ncbi:MAG TPA: potassium transporter Kef [Labilithrix sp.]
MSAIALLMGLLLLSYLGSLLIEGRRGETATKGLPSGIEYVGLGFVVGPEALGVVDHGMIADFEPIVQVALGWLAFVVGLDFGRVAGRRVRTSTMALGVVCAMLTGGAVAFAVFRALQTVHVPGVHGVNAVVLAGGAGAVTAETTRNAVEWVMARWGAKGPVTSLLVESAATDDFAPLLVAGAIFALVPAGNLAMELPAAGWLGASVALGALLGTVTALLLRGAEGYAVWSALVGTLLLGVGTAARFGFCTIFVTFVMGIALAAVSPDRRVLRRMVGPTERAVLFPMLLLAGMRLDPKPLLESRGVVIVVVVALLARVAGKLVSGLVMRFASPAARVAGGGLGLVLLSSGPVSISTGLVFALRFPGVVGDTLLVCAAASAVLGEIVSTLALKGLLTHIGEIKEAPTPPQGEGAPS